MLEPYIDSLQLRFLHITRYHLTERHRMQPRQLEHSVIWLVEDGVLFVRADGRTYQGQCGDLFVIPAGTELFNRTGMAAQVVSINFEGNVPLYGTGDWFELFGIRSQSQASAEVRGSVGRMLGHREEEGVGRKLMLQSDLLHLMAVLIKDGVGSRNDPVSACGDIRVKRAVDYILARPERLPEVRELAEIADVSDSHLRKLFQQYTGLPPAHYIHYVKIEQAKRVLAETDRRISEIGAGLGFSEPNYFARLFKSKTGYTPTEYRRQFRIWGEER
ncbi:helix-turn-helix domain-containing protein [Paenibacillus macerans]|uniref:helix-turn-helix domain-containing protein n=1 Tax=Paenibacillus macerans TaxID=44252 RepID=UPI003D30F74D